MQSVTSQANPAADSLLFRLKPEDFAGLAAGEQAPGKILVIKAIAKVNLCQLTPYEVVAYLQIEDPS